MGEMVKFNGRDSMWYKLQEWILATYGEFKARSRIYINEVCADLKWTKSQFYNAVRQLRDRSIYLRPYARSIRPVRGTDPEKNECYVILGSAEFVEYEIIKPIKAGADKHFYAIESATLAKNYLPEADRKFATLITIGANAANEMINGTLQTRQKLLESHDPNEAA